MSIQTLDDIVIKNICYLNNLHHVSLRQLSTDIGCSESYMQKVVSKKIALTLETIGLIADRYQVHPSSLLRNDMKESEKIRQIVDYLITFDDPKLDAFLTLSQVMTSQK